jgi:hypothetical protein
MDSHPEISFEGNSPGTPWNIISDKAMKICSDGDCHSNLSGPDYFGLASPIICYLIQQMEGAEQCVKYVVKRFAPPEILDAVPGASDQAVMSISASAQNPQPLPGRPICQPIRPWMPEEEETLLRLHRPRHHDWHQVLAALPGRTIAAAKTRWHRIQQNTIEHDEDKTAQPQPQGDFEFQKVARPREPMTPFVGFTNPSLQSQPGAGSRA